MIIESFRIAVGGLLANKVRSALTMLGIFIGVTSVVLLMAAGKGAQGFIDNQIGSLGANTLAVFPVFQTDAQGNPLSAGTSARKPAITDADLEALRDPGRVPGVRSVTAQLSVTVVMNAGAASYQPKSGLTGTTPEYARAANLEVAQGIFFTRSDEEQRTRVVVIGSTVARRLFPTGQAVGKKVRIDNAEFEVVGILKKKGSLFGVDFDDVVYAPLSATRDTLAGRPESYSQVTLEVVDRATSAQVERDLRRVLDEVHRITDPDRRDYGVFSPAQLLKTTETIGTALTALLGAVAGISLLVGGIGVMNIMLVTVAERTREIGTRRALGARRRDLVGQFLMEAVMISLIGGAAGVAAGVALSQIRIGDFTPVVQPNAVILAAAISIAIGVFFGWYPANRAAKLRPIEALRYE